jgi:hypothetical protein
VPVLGPGREGRRVSRLLSFALSPSLPFALQAFILLGGDLLLSYLLLTLGRDAGVVVFINGFPLGAFALCGRVIVQAVFFLDHGAGFGGGRRKQAL